MATKKSAEASEAPEGVGLIYSAMINVMADMEAIVKTKQSDGVRYAFRSIEDVMNAIHPIFVKHKIFAVPTKVVNLSTEIFKSTTGKTQFQSVLQIGYTFYAIDGSSIYSEVAAEASDYSDKATQQAMSYCFKDLLLKTFCVPTKDVQDDGDGKQPDREGIEPIKTKKQESAPAPAPEPAATAEPASPQAWDAIKAELKQFELNETQFHNWSVKTLRKVNINVPEIMADLPKTDAGYLWKVAKESNKLGELLYSMPAAE